MEYWVLYLCSIADSIHTLLMVLGIIGGILSVIVVIMSLCNTQCSKCCYRVCVGKGMRMAGIRNKHIIVPTFIC